MRLKAMRPQSLRGQLLAGILLPVLGFVLLNAASLYHQALQAADTAYDRTLLASAKAIGERLEVRQERGTAQLQATLEYSALEAFEADNRSRLFYKVSGFGGEVVSGFEDLSPPRAGRDEPNPYAALVRFYDDEFRGEPVRMAVLLQPVAGPAGQGMATVQVAETLELRHTLARALLLQTLGQQALLVALIAIVVVAVVQRATRPVRALSQTLRERDEDDLSPLGAEDTPRELQPVVDATNALLARTARLLEHQKRFVRDASHQLRTPLAVLKTQVQSARRGDVAPALALQEIAHTVDGATELANQMLALAKVEQLRHQGDAPVSDWAALVRAVALDVSALIADAGVDFELHTEPVSVRAHEWALRELTRNLLHNAIRHSPRGGRLTVAVQAAGDEARLRIADSGPGIGAAQRERLFQPFATSLPDTAGREGSGLGLAICREIVTTLGGRITLDNRMQDGRILGLDACVTLPSNKEAAER
ncbi:MAG: sensor histidine kinase N-terminal domain-containing protein [Rubrivivax sp.]|nr:sensor histidine kinase N-terminal domain-containing protein [Rubrivivax sp.]